MSNHAKPVNAWPDEKVARFLEAFDADPTRETIGIMAEEYGIGVPAVRARLNEHNRYIRHRYSTGLTDVMPVIIRAWPPMPADAFKGYTREDMAMAARLELARQP